MMRRHISAPEPGAGDEGFSLIELVVAMAILLVASVSVFNALATSTKQVNAVQSMVEAQAKARIVISGMESELRNSFTGDPAMPRVQSVAANAVTFFTADRSTPLRLKKVTYQLTAGTLTRSTTISSNTGPPYTWTFPATAPAITVLKGVQNTTLFVFRDSSGATLVYTAASAPLVATVEVTIQVRDPSAPSTQKAETYTTTVKLRGAG